MASFQMATKQDLGALCREPVAECLWLMTCSETLSAFNASFSAFLIGLNELVLKKVKISRNVDDSLACRHSLLLCVFFYIYNTA